MIKAILFDMDGVLIDAREWHYEALNRALRLFGMEITKYDHLHSFDGLPTKDKLKLLSTANYLPERLHPFINEMKQRYTMQIIYEKCKPMFHHEYALSRLKQEGYRLAVCSNSVRSTIEIMMEKAELTRYIELMMSNEDVSRAKPDPEIYVKAMKKMKLKPEECLVVEDNKNGIEAANRSGANLLAVKDVYDVNYFNIKRMIQKLEN